MGCPMKRPSIFRDDYKKCFSVLIVYPVGANPHYRFARQECPNFMDVHKLPNRTFSITRQEKLKVKYRLTFERKSDKNGRQKGGVYGI